MYFKVYLEIFLFKTFCIYKKCSLIDIEAQATNKEINIIPLLREGIS